MDNAIFKLIEKNSDGHKEEMARLSADGKFFFSEKLTLEGALTGVKCLSDKLYDIKNLYNENNIENLEEAKEVLKELGEKLKSTIDLGEL